MSPVIFWQTEATDTCFELLQLVSILLGLNGHDQQENDQAQEGPDTHSQLSQTKLFLKQKKLLIIAGTDNLDSSAFCHEKVLNTAYFKTTV